MIDYAFTKRSEAEFLNLPKKVQSRIIKKVEHYLKADNPLSFAKRIAGASRPCFRYQMGDYRVIFEWEVTSILILRVGDRKSVYRGEFPL